MSHVSESKLSNYKNFLTFMEKKYFLIKATILDFLKIPNGFKLDF